MLYWLPIASTLLIYVLRMIELKTPRELAAGEVRENLTLRLIVAVGALIFLSSMAEYVLLRRGPDRVFFGVGWGCVITSFAVRRRAIAALGRFWSLQVEIRSEHEFVRNGP